MKIKFISVGKLKEKYLKQGIDEYTKRLSAFTTVEHIEVADEKAPEQMSETEIKQVQEKEGERILQKIHKDDYVTALAIEGNEWSSERLAKEIDQLTTHGKSKLTFVIGGSVGLSDSVMQRADNSLSFSAMTFPHQLMRLILIEQIYRAFKINRGEPYHK